MLDAETTPAPAKARPCLPASGFRLSHLRDGLVLHSSDGLESGNSTPTATIEGCMICSVVLHGAVEAHYGRRVVPFGPGETPGGADGMLVSIAEPVTFSRRARRGTRTRKVNVTIESRWLERTGLLEGRDAAAISRFARTHLAVQRWRPNRRMVALTEEILRPAPVVPALEPLYLESRAIEFFAEATGTLAEDMPHPAAAPGLRARARDIEDYLLANLHAPLDLQTIASALAMSPSSLQRTCRAGLGTSVFDLLRKLRLDDARQRLAADSVSVTEAAFLAGYTSPANFATAFKRAYGMPPSAVRRHHA